MIKVKVDENCNFHELVNQIKSRTDEIASYYIYHFLKPECLSVISKISVHMTISLLRLNKNESLKVSNNAENFRENISNLR